VKIIKKILSILIALILSIEMSSCSSQNNKYEIQFFDVFDTVTDIIIYTKSNKEYDKYKELIYNDLKEYHELFDIYNSYDGINNIKTVNDNAGVKPVKVDQKIIDLLLFSKKEFEKTGGAVNIAFGSVLEIWHLYRDKGIENPEKAELPPMGTLIEASKHTNINNIIIDERNSTVFLSDPKMRLDVGSVGKGYAAEKVAEVARENGLKSALISVGGNVIAVGGKGSTDKNWNVGVQNPDTESDEKMLIVTHLTDVSLVTSGDYQRFYTVDGVKIHHIIDPKTLMPSDYFSSVTVVGGNSGVCDALSTALFNMPLEKGLNLINQMPEYEALWVKKSGETAESNDFKRFTNE